MKRLIKENGKQVGTLYHYTSMGNLMMILDANSLYSRMNSICFTRDQNFNSCNREVSGLDCRLEIDGDALSNNYKIEPYSDQKFVEDDPTRLESEERVSGERISPIIPYIKKITIYDIPFTDPDEKVKRIEKRKQMIENTYDIPVSLEIK